MGITYVNNCHTVCDLLVSQPTQKELPCPHIYLYFIKYFCVDPYASFCNLLSAGVYVLTFLKIPYDLNSAVTIQ
jgi:hypothetical protein